jgi:flagellar biosynthesis/type III secretory pathway M-ring protein FliF/YscJ
MTVVLEDYFYIRPSPWLALGFIGAVLVAIIVGWQYRKRRQGEPIRTRRESSPRKKRKSKDDSKLRKKEESERRKHRDKKDKEIDPKEFFGV